jgi:hypothetical protein
MKSTRRHANPFIQPPGMAEHLADIRTLLAVLLQMKIGERLKKPILGHTIWQVSVAQGGAYSRYRSEKVIGTVGLLIQRDHIYKRAALIAEILEQNSLSPDEIIERSECCILSKDEHTHLESVASARDGWARYKAADIRVMDMLTGRRKV